MSPRARLAAGVLLAALGLAAYGRRYTYVVVTADARRRTSPPSRRVSVTYLAAPEPPVSVTARPGEREARLAWQPPARLVDGSPATGPLAYEVLRAAAADAELTPVATAAPGQLTFTDHGLENERAYRSEEHTSELQSPYDLV